MKNIYKIVSLAVAALILASCNKAEYKQVDYVCLDHYSYTVNETETELSIAVYNRSKTAFSVAISTIDDTAESGVDYEVEGTGVVDFEEGEETKDIKIKINGQVGTFTGNMGFYVVLESATNGVVINGNDYCYVTIKDLDHPLSALFGEYTMYSVYLSSNGYSYGSWNMTMSAYPNDPTKVYLSSITVAMAAWGAYLPAGMAVYGTVNDEKNKITIPVPQPVASKLTDFFDEVPDEYFKLFIWEGANATGKFTTETGEIVFTLDKETGEWFTETPYGFSGEQYMVEEDDDSCIYYYFNAFSSFNANNNPTYFIKKESNN